jgi:hypothetical protein
MPCPDCEQLLTELEALKVELEALKTELPAVCAAVVDQHLQRFLDQTDQVIADLERKHQALVALADRHMHDSLARLSRLEAAMRRLPRGEPPSEPPARH